MSHEANQINIDLLLHDMQAGLYRLWKAHGGIVGVEGCKTGAGIISSNLGMVIMCKRFVEITEPVLEALLSKLGPMDRMMIDNLKKEHPVAKDPMHWYTDKKVNLQNTNNN
jgi:hypothetical protein